STSACGTSTEAYPPEPYGSATIDRKIVAPPGSVLCPHSTTTTPLLWRSRLVDSSTAQRSPARTVAEVMTSTLNVLTRPASLMRAKATYEAAPVSDRPGENDTPGPPTTLPPLVNRLLCSVADGGRAPRNASASTRFSRGTAVAQSSAARADEDATAAGED